MKLLIYTEKASPKLRYVLDHIFGQYFEQSYMPCSDLAVFTAHQGPKLSIGKQGSHLSLANSTFLTKSFDQTLSLSKELPIEKQAIFAISDTEDQLFPFDVLGCIFFLLSRYEEYLPFTGDDHDRFISSRSVLSAVDLFDPPIDRWLLILKQQLEASFPGYQLTYRHHYELIATMDIDHYYDLKYKPWYLKLAKCLNSIKKGNLTEFKIRWRSLFGAHDLFDQYGQFESLFKEHQKLYFLHLGKASKYDESEPISVQAKQEVVAKISTTNATIGIHPSYLSNRDDQALNRELNAFTELTGQSASLSRQHYLMLDFPQSYRRLVAHGITADYSLAFTDHIGFRAGTAHPFYWYDLLNDEVTSLKVHPNALMDVSLQQYMGLSIEEALLQIEELKSICKKYAAPLIFIWHNTTMSNQGPWKNWNKVLARLATEK